MVVKINVSYLIHGNDELTAQNQNKINNYSIEEVIVLLIISYYIKSYISSFILYFGFDLAMKVYFNSTYLTLYIIKHIQYLYNY